MFGDTTYGASADSASWQLLPGNVIRFLNGGYPETQARVSRDAVVVFPGGVDAGAGYYRYQRR